MATRSRIGIINKGEVVADTVYCHWDGRRYVAQILKLYYADVDKIRELISGGDLSSISKFIGEKHDFEKRNEHEDWCTYYKRDRGEENVDPQWLSPSKFWGDSGEEYNYLFKVETGKWYYRCYDSGRWKVLTDEVCEITKEDKEQAKKEIAEQESKKEQHKDIDKMLDDFLAKF